MLKFFNHLLLVCFFVTGTAFGQDNPEKILLPVQEAYPQMKSVNLDSLEIQLSVQTGGILDSTAILGTCVGATNYSLVTDFPSEITFQPTNVTVTDLGVVTSYYRISTPITTPAGIYEGSALFTLLRGTDPCKSRKLLFTINVVEPEIPEADFVASATTIIEEGTIQFQDMTVNPVTEWLWDFGDGESSTDQNPTHSYINAGSYSVSLTATGPAGSDVHTKENYIEVLPKGTPGIQLWSFTAYWGIWSSPVIDQEGNIYVGSMENYLYAFNPDGTLKWSHFAGGAISSIVIGNDSNIYFVSLHNLYALDNKGNRLWSYSLTGDVWDLAIGIDGTVYLIVSGDSNLLAINKDGDLLWGLDLGWTQSMPRRVSIAVDGTVYAVGYIEGTNTSRLNAVDPDGEIKWTRDIGLGSANGYRTSAVIDADGTIYIGGFMSLYAINPDGSDKWIREEGLGFFIHEPAIDTEGNILAIFYRSTVQASVISYSKDGNINWKYDVPGLPRFKSSLTLGADEKCYFTTSDSLLYALNPDGTFSWNFKFDNSSPYVNSSPVINSNSDIIVGYGQRMYAVTSTSNGLADSPWPKEGQNIFKTARKINPPPYLISPKNDSLDVLVDVLFHWSPVVGASSFELEISLNEDFTGSSLYKGNISETSAGMDNLQLNSTYYWRVRANSNEGLSEWSPSRRFVTINPVGIEKEEYFSDLYTLFQNYPNPFNTSTTIMYSLPEPDKVTVRIFDITGKEVLKFDEGLRLAGKHEIQIDGTILDGGIYYYQLQSDHGLITRKMLLVR